MQLTPPQWAGDPCASRPDSATRLAALPLGNTTRPGNPRPNRIPPLQLDALRDPAQPTRGPNRDPVAVPDGGASGGELSSGSPPGSVRVSGRARKGPCGGKRLAAPCPLPASSYTQSVRRLVAGGSVAATASRRVIPRRSLSAGAMTKGIRQPPDGAERKVVTVLFADVDETVPQFGERDPEDVGRMLAGHLERARAEIESYGGSVEQVVGGTTIAVFGVPRTREDDPERAVRAALAIRDALLSERARAGPGARRPGWGVPEVRLRIAITTGKALVRAGRVRPGTASRRGGAEPADPGRVTGDLVSMCARIQQAAPPG